ncbi:hypothetical protein CANARDRAFT_180432, partial [[Candida] arabinofermentans NRRL YB-2248]
LNQTIFNDVRTLLNAGKVPDRFWPDAALFSCYLRNFIYKPSIKNSPAGFINFKPITTKNIHTFGEKCI